MAGTVRRPGTNVPASWDLRRCRDRLGPVPGLDLAGLDHLALARAYGVSAERVGTAGELSTVLRQALAGAVPYLIEVPVTGASEDPVTLW